MTRRERDWGHDNTGVDLATVPDEVCAFCEKPIHEEVVRFRAKPYHVECLVSFGFKAGRDTAPVINPTPIQPTPANPYLGGVPITTSPYLPNGTVIYTVTTDTTSGTAGSGIVTMRSDHTHGNTVGSAALLVNGIGQ